MEDQPNTSSMIALLPVDGSWSSLKLPHLTLVYSGETDTMETGDFNRLAKDASVLATMNGPITLDAIGVEIFGEDPDRVDVLTFKSNSVLDAMRHIVEPWNQSEYTDFKPHVTIGPPGSHVLKSNLPSRAVFDRIYVGWGAQCLTFNMNRQNY